MEDFITPYSSSSSEGGGLSECLTPSVTVFPTGFFVSVRRVEPGTYANPIVT